ncbi:MAG: DUF1289 domain-containing protein [Armatimonadetes bacterium]|nr:DUF1289 domain-containing protein [Armatimonadota bacterium]
MRIRLPRPDETLVQQVLPCPSPCVKRCGVDETFRCSGCLRTGRQIASWLDLSDRARWELVAELDVLRSDRSRGAG